MDRRMLHTRVGTPRIVTVSISNFWPGAVSSASASAIDIAGQAGSSATIGWLSTGHLSIIFRMSGLDISPTLMTLVLIHAPLKAIGESAFEHRVCHTARRARASAPRRHQEHTSELQSLMRISYAVFCLKKKNTKKNQYSIINIITKI